MSRLVLLVLPLAACFYDTTSPLPADFDTCAVPPAEGVAPAAPTYWRDVKEIVDSRCAGCHVPDGGAPFPLTTYAEVEGKKNQLAWAVEARIMPPWQPDTCCNHYRGDRSLTEDQLATLLTWVATGALEGDPADAPTTPPPVPETLPRVDVEITRTIGWGADEEMCGGVIGFSVPL